MADFNVKDDLLGFGRSQLKYMLFFNSTLDMLTDYTHKRGLFYYDTDLNSVEFIKDNATGWNSFIHTISQNNPDYVDNDDITDRLVMGTKFFGQVKSFNPGFEGFLKVDGDGHPLSQPLILFEDIEPTDYTTIISSPGLDTRFATEKAIVDYVNTAFITPQNNILNWDGNKYTPYLNKLQIAPEYPYFYSSSELPDISSMFTFIGLSGTLAIPKLRVAVNGNYMMNEITNVELKLINYTTGTGLRLNYNEPTSTIYFFSHKLYDSGPDIIIGTNPTGYGNRQYLQLSDVLSKFIINYGVINIPTGIANKYLYLDASKNITYVDAPSGGVTPVDSILDWDTDRYKPYTSKTVASLYTGITIPNSLTSILNYDGVFRASQLYEGDIRVMTTHGSWPADGTLHEVTTSSHAGFCPALPAISPYIDRQFLRADGTWANIDIGSAWERNLTELAVVPSTITDAVMIRSTSNLGSLTIGETGTSENIVFGIRDIADNQTYDTTIKWLNNGSKINDLLSLGIKGTGSTAIAELYTELFNLTLETPILNLITDYNYSNAFYTEIKRDYSGAITSRIFNSASPLITNAYASKIIGVHPTTSDYATINLTVTSKNFAGISGEWEDGGTGYLKHSANLVSGGMIKPAINIGTREGKPIRFFVGGDSDLNFDNSTLRQVLWDNGNISIGDHTSISTHKALYTLDVLSGSIRLLSGSLLFGGTIGSADAVTNLYKGTTNDLITDNTFRAIGGYKSSDGTEGITMTGTLDSGKSEILTITIKNGLITALSITGGA